MGQTSGREPLAAVDLVVSDDVANAVGEDLGTAAGHGIDTGFLHALERLLDGHLAAPGKEGDLDHGEGLYVDLGEALLEPADEIHEVFEGEVGVEAAYDVELGHGVGVALTGGLEGLVERHGVGGRARLSCDRRRRGGQLATHTLVGLDVAIDVEVGEVPVEPLADEVGEPAYGEDVPGAVQLYAVVEVESLPRLDFFSDGPQRWVVRLKGVARLERG